MATREPSRGSSYSRTVARCCGYAGTMAAASRKKRDKNPLEFRNTALGDALQTQDMAAIAFALRHGPTVVPLMRPASKAAGDAGEVWTFRDPETGNIALLLFSDAKHKPESLPPAVGLHSPEWLHQFLTVYRDTITTVFFDIAGPHPMQATPDELLRALEA